MKKKLLFTVFTLVFGMTAAGYANAKDVSYAPVKASKSTTAAVASRSATDDGYELRFCENTSTWMSVSKLANTTYTCFQYIDADVATQLAGNKITDITFSAYIKSATSGLSGSIFVAEDESLTPVTSTETKIKSSYNANTGNGVQTVELEEPYEIKAGQPFYFGYTAQRVKAGTDYPIGVDECPATNYAGYINIKSSQGSNKGTTSAYDALGTNIILYATTVGEKNMVDNLFGTGFANNGSFTMNVSDVATGLDIPILVKNFGNNPITSLDYSVTVNGGEPTNHTSDVDIAQMSTENVTVNVQVPTGMNNVSLTINSVNGVAQNISKDIKFMGVNGGYQRMMVCEEATGTWCQYCPAGIVGLEYMSEKYPDTFLPIAIHVSSSSSRDPFETASYLPLLYGELNSSGVPSCIINRDPLYLEYPSAEELEQVYMKWKNQLSPVDIELQVVKNNTSGSNLTLNTTSTFALDLDNANLALAFVVIENGLKGTQTNAYSGSSTPMGGWENKPRTVQWIYSDVARDIYDCYGLDNSVPTTIVEGEKYVYSKDISLVNNVKDTSNIGIIALMIDRSNGTILNAKRVMANDFEASGITDISADENVNAQYYNLQGMPVGAGNLPAGIYIIKSGNTTTKTVIR